MFGSDELPGWHLLLILYAFTLMRYSVASVDENQGHTPNEPLALLLLFGLPLVFTLRKLLELFGLTERSHQLLVEPDDYQMPPLPQASYPPARERFLL